MRGVLAVVIGLGLGIAGCGTDADAPRSRGPAADLRDLERHTLDTATRPQIERFAGVRIPASATNLRSASRSAMDTQLLVSFRLPRGDLAAFVRSGRFARKLVDDDRAIGSTTGSEIGWDLNRAKRVKGLSDIQQGRARNLVIVLDEPSRPEVHLEALSL